MNKKILIAIIAILTISIAGTVAYYALFAQNNTSAKGTLVVQTNVSGVNVTISGPEETLKTGMTAVQNKVTFTGLPDGSYQCIATKDGLVLKYAVGASIIGGGTTNIQVFLDPIVLPVLMELNPNAMIIKQGSSGTVAVTVTSLNDYVGTVSLSCTQLPSGVTAVFDSASVTLTAGGKASTTLTLTVSSTATKGVYPVYIDLSHEQGEPDQPDITNQFIGLLLQVS